MGWFVALGIWHHSKYGVYPTIQLNIGLMFFQYWVYPSCCLRVQFCYIFMFFSWFNYMIDSKFPILDEMDISVLAMTLSAERSHGNRGRWGFDRPSVRSGVVRTDGQQSANQPALTENRSPIQTPRKKPVSTFDTNIFSGTDSCRSTSTEIRTL